MSLMTMLTAQDVQRHGADLDRWLASLSGKEANNPQGAPGVPHVPWTHASAKLKLLPQWGGKKKGEPVASQQTPTVLHDMLMPLLHCEACRLAKMSSMQRSQECSLGNVTQVKCKEVLPAEAGPACGVGEVCKTPPWG